MDRQITAQEQSRNKLKSVLPYLLVAALLVASYFLFRDKLYKKGNAKDFRIVKVENGNIKQTLTAAGVIVPASERIINAPVATEIQEVLISTGNKVEKGNVILKLDQEYTRLEYERLKDELALRSNNIEKLKLQFDKDLRDLDYKDQIKALQLSELKAQLADQERLLNVGGATKEEVEAAQMQLDVSKIEKKILENELTFKRNVNSTDKENLRLEYEIQNKRLKELGRKLKETKVISPQEGVITWINDNIGETVAIGEPLVRIANLDKFEVEASLSDTYIAQLQIGLPVEIRVGKERLNGAVSRVLPEVVNNTARFYVELEKDAHKSLRPNLRCEVFVIKNEKNDVLRAKRGQALKGTESQFLYKVVDNVAIKVRVKKGLVSSEYFEIKEGLKQGDRIIISDVEEFDHMDTFQIEE